MDVGEGRGKRERDVWNLETYKFPCNMETYITICKIDSQWEFAVMIQGTQTGAL